MGMVGWRQDISGQDRTILFCNLFFCFLIPAAASPTNCVPAMHFFIQHYYLLPSPACPPSHLLLSSHCSIPSKPLHSVHCSFLPLCCAAFSQLSPLCYFANTFPIPSVPVVQILPICQVGRNRQGLNPRHTTTAYTHSVVYFIVTCMHCMHALHALPAACLPLTHCFSARQGPGRKEKEGGGGVEKGEEGWEGEEKASQACSHGMRGGDGGGGWEEGGGGGRRQAGRGVAAHAMAVCLYM